MTYIESKNLDALTRNLFEFYYLLLKIRNGQASTEARRIPEQLVWHFTNMLLLQRLMDSESGLESDPRQLLMGLGKLKSIETVMRNAVSAKYAETFGIFMVPLEDKDLVEFTACAQTAFERACKLCPPT